MNLPNILTVSRVVLTVVFIWFALRPEFKSVCLAAVIFGIAALTDYFDGSLARATGQFSDFGKLMDPIADKVLVLSAFFVLMKLGYVPVWVFALVSLREIIVTISRLWFMKNGLVVPAEREGKIKTFLQMSTIILMMAAHLVEVSGHGITDARRAQAWTGFFLTTQVLLALTLALTVFSGLKYFWTNRNNVSGTIGL